MEGCQRVQEESAVWDLIEEEGKEFGYGNTGINENNDITAFLEQIEKMDIILKMKANEEKNARLSRIQTEEESRNILSKLPFPKRPRGVKANQEEFMRLLNNFENTKEGASTCLEQTEVNGMAEEEGKEKAESKKEKMNCQQSNTNNLPFVERNILQLAKNGRGTLSLTDDEQSRIENLLVDIEDESKTQKEREPSKTGQENEEEFYAIDSTTKSILSQIDQQLEGLKKLKTQSELAVLDKKEESAVEEGKEYNSAGERKKGKKKSNRLEEIDKLLNSMTTATDKEIIPLSEKEMENLIRVSMQSLCGEKGSSSGEGDDCQREGVQLSREVITELVSNARSLMPKFKYRFDVT